MNLDFRGKPTYQADQCIACAACTKACPANALVMEVDMETGERRWEISMARCIFCGRCEEVCPTHAIALSPEFELAVTNKADLYEEARFALAPCTLCGTYFAPASWWRWWRIPSSRQAHRWRPRSDCTTAPTANENRAC